ncbi:hypothetical protein AB0C18_35820 [Nonomuraea muscovyensis]
MQAVVVAEAAARGQVDLDLVSMAPPRPAPIITPSGMAADGEL